MGKNSQICGIRMLELVNDSSSRPTRKERSIILKIFVKADDRQFNEFLRYLHLRLLYKCRRHAWCLGIRVINPPGANGRRALGARNRHIDRNLRPVFGNLTGKCRLIFSTGPKLIGEALRIRLVVSERGPEDASFV